MAPISLAVKPTYQIRRNDLCLSNGVIRPALAGATHCVTAMSYLYTKDILLPSKIPCSLSYLIIMYHLIHNISQLRTPSVVDYNYLTFCMKAYHTSPQRLAWLRLPKLAPNVPVIQHKVALYVTACQAAVEGVDMSCNSPPPGERQLCDAPRTTRGKPRAKP
jgi:hypothetical protein